MWGVFKMKIDQYRYTRDNFKISTTQTSADEVYSKKKAKSIVHDNIKQFVLLQRKLYAQHRFGIIVVLQALDAAGKDSTIDHVFSGVNPAGFEVTNFKQPSHEELRHDYLWRANRALPEKGKIGIFNRSYYEDVLVSRVHPQILLNGNLPGINQLKDINEDIYQRRYDDIRHFEDHLTNNGYLILKFFLNISKDEQKARFLSRIENPSKNWKLSASDIKERRYWDDYQQAYEMAINATATADNPWYVLPADDKWTERAIFSQILLDRVSQLPLAFPQLSPTETAELESKVAELKNS